VDPTIVRGLDYYTKTAFEFVTDKIAVAFDELSDAIRKSIRK